VSCARSSVLRAASGLHAGDFCSPVPLTRQVFVVTGPLYLPRLTRNGYSMGFSLIGDVRPSGSCLMCTR
jgi:hypothetical protein